MTGNKQDHAVELQGSISMITPLNSTISNDFIAAETEPILISNSQNSSVLTSWSTLVSSWGIKHKHCFKASFKAFRLDWCCCQIWKGKIVCV